MSADRSEYQIKINMATDASSTDQALKDLAQHLQTAKKSGTELVHETTRINAAHDSVGPHAKHAGHEAAEGMHEVKEALHLVKFEAEGALGPIGELIRLLSNPWVFAIAGLTEAYRLWNEQLEKERENLSKNIELSREQTELFKTAHTQALLNAADAANKFAIEQKHAQDNVDLLTESMKRSIEFAKELKTETDANAASVDALTQSWIKYMVETGKLTPQEGDAAEDAERKRLRKQKEGADDAAAQAEVTAKSDRAHAARAQAGIAADQIPGLEDHRSDLDDRRIAAEGLQKSAEAKQAELDKKAADALAASKQGPSFFKEAAQAIMQPGESIGDAIRRTHAKLDVAAANAQEAAEANREGSQSQKKRASKLQHQIDEVDADIESANKLFDSRKELARVLEDEAADARDRLARSKAARAENDKNDDAARNLDRLTELHKKIAGGTATPDEQTEYGAGSLTNVGAAIAQTRKQIDAIRNNIRFEGGHASKEEFNQLIALNAELVGLMENKFAQDSRTQDQIAKLEQQVKDMKNTYKNNR